MSEPWIICNNPSLSPQDAHNFFASYSHLSSQSSLASVTDVKAAAANAQAEAPAFVFDYIVVGGGTAGLAVASRLAEDSNVHVCVLEAGEARSDALVDIPGLYGQSVGNPNYDWSFETVPQPELNNRQVSASAGKVLGGSSAINYMVRMRASSLEYDSWSQFGVGWDWAGLLPSFKKSQNFVAPIWGTDQIFPGIDKQEDEAARFREAEFCGHDGPVHASHNVIYTEVLKPFIESLNALKIKTNRTPEYGDSTGIFNIGTAVNRKEGTRSYAANSYLTPGGKENLIVLTNCTVTKILFSAPGTEPFTATGIQFRAGLFGDFENVMEMTAKKEVILSAGSYNTPKLLELSGVGNPEILQKYGIATVINLPGVGENLQEHLYVPGDFKVKEGIFTFDRLRNDPVYEEQQRLQYAQTKDGAYATTVSAYGFIKLSQFIPEAEITEMRAALKKEIDAMPEGFHKEQYKIQESFLDHEGVGDVEVIMVPHVFGTTPPAADQSYVGIIPGLPRSFSRGSVHIKSNDHRDPPAIDPQYLENSFDLKCIAKATQFMRKISETGPLKMMVTGPSTPSAAVQTEKDFEDFVRSQAASIQHPIGTAAMAPRAKGGVVDNKLLVYGTKNVRIVDMSVAPLHVAAHLLDTAYAIGEKAYTLMKA